MSGIDHNIHTDGIIVDADKHFTINTTNRAISPDPEYKKLTLMQYDNKSERYSFDIDRKIDGHDLINCNRVQIHFINIGSNKQKHPGLYLVDDVHVNKDDEDKISFTWLISQDATLLSGVLSFLVSFECTDGETVLYRWSSSIFSAIQITAGMDNDNTVIEMYADELLAWEHQMATEVIPDLVDQCYIERNFATSEEVATIFSTLSDSPEPPIEYIQEASVEAGVLKILKNDGEEVTFRGGTPVSKNLTVFNDDCSGLYVGKEFIQIGNNIYVGQEYDNYELNITYDPETTEIIFASTSTKDAISQFKFTGLKPNTTYTVSFTMTIPSENRSYLFGHLTLEGYVEVGTRLASSFTTDANGEYCFNDTFQSGLMLAYEDDRIGIKEFQLEEGSIATKYMPYNRVLVCRDDFDMSILENEMQKSKNLCQNTLENFQLTAGHSNIVIYQKEKPVNYPLHFYFKSSGFECVEPEGILLKFKYSTGGASLLPGRNYTPEYPNCEYEFDGSKDLVSITLVNDCQATGTIEFVQLEENDHFTGYLPYRGEITHNGDASVLFAEEERQKSKNLFDLSRVKFSSSISVDIENNSFTFTAFSTYTNNKLKDFADLEVGKTYRLIGTTTSSNKAVYLPSVSQYWYFNNTITITQEMLDTTVGFYGTTDVAVTISELMITEGTNEESYRPYNGPIIHANDLNGLVNGTILWENKDFQSSAGFPPQTINLSSVDYDYLEVYYLEESDGLLEGMTVIEKGYDGSLSTIKIEGTVLTISNRTMTRKSDTSFEFGDGEQWKVVAISGVTEHITGGSDTTIVPIKIVGYKRS